MPNKSLDASRDSVFRIIIGPTQLLSNAVARSTQPLGGLTSGDREILLKDFNLHLVIVVREEGA